MIRVDGTPVQGATVGVIVSDDSTVTSDSGRFVLRHLTAGAHVLWVHGVGFEPARVAITLSSERRKSLTITTAHPVPVLAPVVTTEHFPAGYSDVGLDKRIHAGSASS